MPVCPHRATDDRPRILAKARHFAADSLNAPVSYTISYIFYYVIQHCFICYNILYHLIFSYIYLDYLIFYYILFCYIISDYVMLYCIGK